MSKPENRSDRMLRLMPMTDDLTLIILKGHLLIEEQLNDFFDRCAMYPRILDGARLSFAQKLRVVRAFCVSPNDSVSWLLADELNRLRNKISHKVEVLDLDALVDAFVAIPKFSIIPGLSEPTRALRLKWAIHYIAGGLEALTEVMALDRKAQSKRKTKGA